MVLSLSILRDDRYKHMIGKEVLLPLVNRMIPIIADELVEPEFGTGASESDCGT